MSKALKELKKVKEKEQKAVNGDSILQEATAILLNAHDEDTEMLGKIGLDHQLKYEKELTQDIRRTKRAEEIYQSDSFTGAQIKELCKTYFLKLLPVEYYNGSIPVDLPRVTRQFLEKAGIENYGQHNFYILAPINQFNTIKKVPIQADPILFYRETDTGTTRVRFARENDVFTRVHDWGNDFTWVRKYAYLTSWYNDSSDEISVAASMVVCYFFLIASLVTGLVFAEFELALFFMGIGLFIILSNIGEKKIDREWNEDTR